MKHIVIFLMALFLSAPAFAGKLKSDAIACKEKEPLDILTVLVAMGDMEGLTKTETEFVDEKKCVRLTKGTEVKISKTNHVLAGDPRIRGNKAHHRIGYHMASIFVNGDPLVIHLQVIETGE